MARNPPFSIEKVPDRIDLPVDIEEAKDCQCDPGDWPNNPYPDDDELDPTLVKDFDKWNLWQCSNCGGIWWNHKARADYL